MKLSNRFGIHRLGIYLSAGLPIMNLGLWIALQPGGKSGRSDAMEQVIGEAFGSTMMLLMAVSLLLSTRLRFLEPLFGGLDRMYVVHRQAGAAALLFIPLHFILMLLVHPAQVSPGRAPGYIAMAGFVVMIMLALAPRLSLIRRVVRMSYRSWRISHKFIGLFFIFGTVHWLLVDPIIQESTLLFAILLGACAIGVVSYLYTELLAGLFRRKTVCKVVEVNRLNDRTAEVVLRPATRLRYNAGQFVFVRFPGDRQLSEPHPFTVSSAPGEEHIRLTISARGDFTRSVRERLAAGQAAVVEGGYGRKDYRQYGTVEQVWIAAGIGITPFISWIRDMKQEPQARIDLYYTVRTPDEALFLPELLEAARKFGLVRVHVHHSAAQGRLSIGDIAAATGRLDQKHVYMCGPASMLKSFKKELRRHGVRSNAVHYEAFAFR